MSNMTGTGYLLSYHWRKVTEKAPLKAAIQPPTCKRILTKTVGMKRPSVQKYKVKRMQWHREPNEQKQFYPEGEAHLSSLIL